MVIKGTDALIPIFWQLSIIYVLLLVLLIQILLLIQLEQHAKTVFTIILQQLLTFVSVFIMSFSKALCMVCIMNSMSFELFNINSKNFQKFM